MLTHPVTLRARERLQYHPPTRTKDTIRHPERRLVQLLQRGPIDLSNTAQVRRGIREERVRGSAESRLDLLRSIRLREVELEEQYVFAQRLNRPNVHADHPAARADALREDLEPAAGPGAELDHGCTRSDLRHGAEQVEELVGRTGAVPRLTRPSKERIAELVARRSISPLPRLARRSGSGRVRRYAPESPPGERSGLGSRRPFRPAGSAL